MRITVSTAFVEDYTYLRQAGLDHREIAQRLRIKRESLLRRAFRHGCYIPEREELLVMTCLDGLIGRGQPFQVGHHFRGCERRAVMSALVRARHEGRIAQVGWAYDGKHHVRIWQATEAVSAVAS